MDAWKDREIRAMRVGSNAKMNSFFEKHGVSKLSIKEKYDSPAAAMWRETISALKEGRSPPTDIKQFEDEAEAEKSSQATRNSSGVGGGGSRSNGTGGLKNSSSSTSSSSSSMSGFGSASGGGNTGSISAGGGSVSNDFVERELKARREAEERLKAKFGEGGLKGQSISSSYNPEPSRNNNNSSTDDLLGFDLGAHTQKVAAFANTAVRGLADAAKVGARAVAEGSREVSKRVVETNVGDTIAGAATKLRGALEDPALVEKVTSTASSLWGATSGFLSRGVNFVSQTLAAQEESPETQQQQMMQRIKEAEREQARRRELSRQGQDEGGVSDVNEGNLSSKRNAALYDEDDDDYEEEEDEDDINAKKKKVSSSTAQKVSSPNDDDDDAAWLGQQVSQAAIKPKEKAANWNDWLDNEDGNDDNLSPSLSSQQSDQTKKAATLPTQQSTKSQKQQKKSSEFAGDEDDDDDFFASYGINAAK